MPSSRLRRLLGLALVALAALYPAYLVAGNVFVDRYLLDLLNRRPERLLVGWRSASTPWPGVVRAKGFTLRVQSRAVQWWVVADRGMMTIDLPKLLGREFEAEHVRGTGVVFRLRRRLDAPTLPQKPLAGWPAIPGLTNPPVPPPESFPRPPRQPNRKPWTIDLRGFDLDEVREVWIEERRFAGRARGTGGFRVRLRGLAEVFPSRFQVAEGTLTVAGRPALTGLSGDFDAEIAPFDPRRRRGWAVFAIASGRARLRGRVHGLGLVPELLARSRWVTLEGGGGPVAADLRVGKGEPLPGSWIEMRPAVAAARFLDFRATGAGRLRWSLAPGKFGQGGRPPQAHLRVDIADVRIQRQGYATAHVRGERLSIRLSGPQPRDRLLLVPERLALDLPRAEVPDLTFYNAYIPPGLGIAVQRGAGRISGRFAAAAPDWRGSGELSLRGKGVAARLEDVRVRGDFDLTTRIRRADLAERIFDLSGSDLRVTGLQLLEDPADPSGAGGGAEPGWWARLHVERGRLALLEPVFLRAELEASLRDPAPVLAYLGARNPALRWLDTLRDVRGVAATARVALGADEVVLDPLVLVAGNGQVHGRLRMREGSRQGVMLLSWGPLAAGLELDGTRRDWKLVRPRSWYATHTTAP